jgi:hypothetical protein
VGSGGLCWGMGLGSREALSLECFFYLLVSCAWQLLGWSLVNHTRVGTTSHTAYFKNVLANSQVVFLGFAQCFSWVSCAFFLASVFSCFLHHFPIIFQFKEVWQIIKIHIWNSDIFFLPISQYLLIPGSMKVIFMKNV